MRTTTLSRNQRLTLLGLAVVVIVVAFVIARSGGGGSNDNSSTKTTTGGGTEPNVVVVHNAKPVGGIQKLTYKKGGRIDFTVRSDPADEIHFHGYDIGKDIEAGGSVHFKAPAKIEGRF